MAKQLYDENGAPIALPRNAEDAKRHRYAHYAGDEECPACVSRGFSGMLARKRYTATGGCVHCATVDAIELQSLATYAAAIDGGRYVVLDGEDSGRAVPPEYVSRMEEALDLVNGPFPTTRQGAVEMGVDYYIRDVPCRTKGHLGVNTIKGECYYCERERTALSPRQEAIREGKKWYLPTEPCPKCNKVAEKRVDNGQCRGCTDNGADDGRETPDSVMMREAPDLVISCEDAKAAGIRVYRTGLPCRKGHTGYRYVSTGNCIECLRE